MHEVSRLEAPTLVVCTYTGCSEIQKFFGGVDLYRMFKEIVNTAMENHMQVLTFLNVLCYV
jgi:hypothetical protein